MIGKLLGHTQPSTTQRYAHLATDPIRAAVNVIGAQIVEAMSTLKPATPSTSSKSRKFRRPAQLTLRRAPKA
jgi:site-specific recombinase XerD